jgi:hypothetical protein
MILGEETTITSGCFFLVIIFESNKLNLSKNDKNHLTLGINVPIKV